MKLYIGCDHRGVELKNKIIKSLTEDGFEVFDTKLKNHDKDDYPDFAFEVANNIKDDCLGILICGNGIGISIAANKVKGIRCARCVNTDDAFKAKTHNGANIVAIGADNSFETAIDIISVFITTKAPNEEKHIKRIEKILKYEDEAYNGL